MTETKADQHAETTRRLRETCRELLASGTVNVVIGYGAEDGAAPHPVFCSDPESTATLVFDERCHHNLTTYLTRPEIRAMGRAAVVVKGCDERAAVVLRRESQLDDQVYLVGVACSGVGQPLSPRCRVCDVHQPTHSDEVIGEVDNPPVEPETRYARLDEFLRSDHEQRLAYWTEELSRCTRCHACRQVCPLCYCPVCVMDKNRPQTVDTSAHLKGVMAFHITRAFHLAGRCVGCGACAEACPAGINLPLLNMSLAKAAETEFGFRPGMDPDAEPILGDYSTRDTEDFIR